MYLLLWCQCPCFKWKIDLFALCCVHKISAKVKEKTFLWLTQLKVAVTQNMRSQSSWFCFILNKLFLLRKMFFCLEVNWRQTFDPFVCSFGGTLPLLLLLLDLIVVGLTQEAGRPTLWYWPSCCIRSEESLVCCVALSPCLQWMGINGCYLLIYTRKWCCCWHARNRESILSLRTVYRSGTLLILKSWSSWI